jgi:hypothetical protein
MRNAAMAIGLAMVLMGAAPGKAANPLDVVAALVEKPPSVLSGLEAIVGPLHRNPAQWEEAVGPLRRVSPSPAVARAYVELAIDPFHQDPPKVADPSLAHWALDFQTGRDACRKLLARRFPKPAELRDGGRPVLRFGDVYFSALDVGDGFRLSWYREEPLFAIPERSEAETARLLADLAAIANAGFTRQAIEARFGRLVPDRWQEKDLRQGPTWELTYHPSGAARPDELAINFKRPLPSRDLYSRIGIERPAVRSNDTHLQSRDVFDQAHRSSPETGYPMPALRGYVIDIEIDPEGLVETGQQAPGSPVWKAEGSRIVSFHAFLPRAD